MVTAKKNTIYSYYKKKEQAVDETQDDEPIPETNAQDVQQLVEPIASPNPRVISAQPICDVQDFVKGDPALRRQILDCPIDKQYDIRKAYMKLGPYQPKKDVYPSSICSLLKLYKAAFLVLKDIASCKGSGTSPSTRAKAAGAVKLMMSFDFVFILHVMKELMGITDLLCKKLQQKSQDIVNAMHDVATTKELIQKLRDDGWDNLLSEVVSFCEKHDIQVPDMNSFYVDYIRSRKEDETSVRHHYQYDVFTVAVDQQLQELNSRFSEQTTKLLILCNSLDPRNSYGAFKIDDVCLLATKFYPSDFSEQEISNLRCQLRHYELDVPHNPEFQNLPTIAALCRKLAETGRSKDYHLIDRLIHLILTLPVSTATTERAFSAMKLVKTRLRNKMEDEFLRDCLLTYIEKEMAQFPIDTIIDDFNSKKRRRVELK